MSRTGWRFGLATGMVLTAVGCSDTGGSPGADAGDGGGGSESSVTRQQFAERANQICQENVAELEEALGNRDAPDTLKEGRRLVRTQVVPIIHKGNEQMRELERPPADDAALEQLFDGMDEVLDGLMDVPDPFVTGPNPFADLDPEFLRLGMDDCAG